jgi:hypothetical protein
LLTASSCLVPSRLFSSILVRLVSFRPDWFLIISFTLHACTQFKRKKALLVAHTELIARNWESAAASGREQLHIDPLWLPNIFAWESAFTTLMTVGRPLSMRFGIALIVFIAAFLTRAVQAITSVVDLQYTRGNAMASMARMVDLLIRCVPAWFAACQRRPRPKLN